MDSVVSLLESSSRKQSLSEKLIRKPQLARQASRKQSIIGAIKPPMGRVKTKADLWKKLKEEETPKKLKQVCITMSLCRLFMIIAFFLDIIIKMESCVQNGP